MLGAFFISGTHIPAIERAVTSLFILEWRLFLFPEATATIRNEVGKNIAKIIKSIWLNNIMPVSKNTNIVIPKLKNKRKNTIPKRFTTCGIVRLLLSSSISVFTTSSLVFPSSSFGLAYTRASIRSVPISSALLFPN